MRTTACLVLTFLLATCAHAVVDVSFPPAKVTTTEGETRRIQEIAFANEVASYTLVYDYTVNVAKPGEATSNWWGWSAGFIPIGMTQPSNPNWYWQAFCNWYFDDEDLSKRPATVRVVRAGGADGVVEFTWDTPRVKATLSFALASGSDKLLMLGSYEPKVEVKASRVTLSCYPATFEQPRNRAVTTALGTRRPGTTVKLDLAREHWVLYEDTTPERPGCGSAGLVIGTPEAFSGVDIPVGDYGIITTVHLKPGVRSFGLGLYDFPSLPDYEQTRRYFGAGADAEAPVIGRAAAAGTGQVLPAIPVEAQRLAALQAANAKVFQRPPELWQPDDRPLPFPWARQLPGGAIRTSLFVPRYRAWETMELARRLEMKVDALYFDGSGKLADAEYWPYAGTTGQGALPYGIAMKRAVALAQEPQAELIMVAGVSGAAIPSTARTAIVEQVAAGKGLLLAGSPDGFPADLFKTPDEAAAKALLAGLAWEQLPGFRPGDRGRVDPVVQVYRYGRGRVVVLRLRPTTYGCLVPASDASEGLDAALDRSLAVAARAAATAAGRSWQYTPAVQVQAGKIVFTSPAPLPAGLRQTVRVQDDLGRALLLAQQPLSSSLSLPTLPAGRTHYLDYALTDGAGKTLGYGFQYLAAAAPLLSDLKLSPARQPAEVLVPKVPLVAGGKLQVSARVGAQPRASRLLAEVWDAFGRLTARGEAAAPAAGGTVTVALTLPRPVAVVHYLDLSLRDGATELACERQRFTVPLPYPYDDFTALVWSYAGGDPVLQRTDRLCYEWGADLSDLCHMGGSDDSRSGGYNDAGAAREYAISARSGLRLIPYVTRIAGESNARYERTPCLHDPAYLAKTKQGLVRTCRQAEPYSPAAYTLGDENYLFSGQGEVCHRPESVAAFRQWLQTKYPDIAALNAAWGTTYADFAAIGKPLTLPEVASQTVSFAPWIDHKLFMNEAFADTHDQFAATIQTVDPQAKVGYDGFLGFNWQSGYDFERLGRNLRLNQTYTANWLQGQLARDFKRPGALTGAWGNSDADTEEGWHAFPFHCLLNGDNSVWWWTSWGCDYIPFNPDTSQSDFGKWFFESVAKAAQGPGKLLLHAGRWPGQVAVLHSEPDMMAAAVAYQAGQRTPWAGDGPFLAEQEAVLHGLQDLGLQTSHVGPRQLEQGGLDPAAVPALWLPYASCLSDRMAANLTSYVEAGGKLIVDGRAGYLTADGCFRGKRALDDLLGVRGEAGLEGFGRPAVEATAQLTADGVKVTVLEPGLKLTTARAQAVAGREPLLITREVGKGRTVLVNVALGELRGERTQPGRQAAETALADALELVGVPAGGPARPGAWTGYLKRSPISVALAGSSAPPLCLQTSVFGDRASGGARYVGLLQDFRVRGLKPQQLRLRLTEPAVAVYDLLAGRRVPLDPSREWNATIGRGYPLLYALLPYTVQAVSLAAPATAARGGTVQVSAEVRTTGGARTGYHVVRLDVYAPGAETPHRQYSANLGCGDGKGSATIPFALNDARGTWRLRAHDVASGVAVEREIGVQ